MCRDELFKKKKSNRVNYLPEVVWNKTQRMIS